MGEILITHGIPMEGFGILKEHRIYAPAELCAFTEEELKERIGTADAVVACGRLTGDVIRKGKNLRIISNYGAGYDSVDIAAARECGVYVTNIPDTVTDDTAEMAVGLMLSVSRRIGEMNLRLRREAPSSLFGMGRNMGMSLKGKTLGVIGVGRIGKRVCMLAKSFGMRVIGYARSGADPMFCEPKKLDEIFSQSDIVSLHCPLTKETESLMNREAFSKMKDGAILINTSRGRVVDHEALKEALLNGKLSGVGLDVYPDEPEVPQWLIRHPSAVLTPHYGSNTRETRFEMAKACALQILDALDGRRPENIVNGL